MKIYDFTEPELNLFREMCNFTPDEATLFEYRSRYIPLEECAERMDVSVSTVKRISRRVNRKIMKIL